MATDYQLSPNMNLPIPTIGVDAGPDWAANLNNSLTIIDGHTHAIGSGVQVTPAGLNINADLNFNSNNAIALRSVRFTPQLAPLNVLNTPADIGCIYESGVDLWYNDGNGISIRLTASGGIVGAPGTIENLVPPVTVIYDSADDTFVFQSNSNVPANIDAGSYIFRNITAGSDGITVSPPAALASNYTLTLPLLPLQTNVMTLDVSGNIGSITYDMVGEGMSVVGADSIASNIDATGANDIGSVMTAPGADAIAAARTRTVGTTVGIGGIAISASCGAFSTNNGTGIDVTNLTVTITTSGRPVLLTLMPDGTANQAYIAMQDNSGGASPDPYALINYLNGVALVGGFLVGNPVDTPETYSGCPYNAIDISVLNTPGTYTYTVATRTFTLLGVWTVYVQNMVLVAYEL